MSRRSVELPDSVHLAAAPVLASVTALETALALTLAAVRAYHAPLKENDWGWEHRPPLERRALHLLARVSDLQRAVDDYREHVDLDIRSRIYVDDDSFV
jgi:hypothetical protein